MMENVLPLHLWWVARVVLAVWCTAVVLWRSMPKHWKRMAFALYSLLRLLVTVRLHALWRGGQYYSAVDFWEAQADAHPDRVQVIVADENRNVTLLEMEALANKVAHWTSDVLGLQPGETVALMMLNRPEFISFWMGCAKQCLVTALINTNAMGSTLLHSVKLATQACTGTGRKVLVVDAELYAAFSQDEAVMRGLTQEQGVRIYVWQELVAVGGAVCNCSPIRRSIALRKSVCKESDALLLIFTSGTTGLPKASKISHSRWFIASLPLGQFCELGPTDRLYSPLPLYHSAAGMMGAGAAIRTGAALVIRKKFSVSKFSDDCVKFRVTAVQYIGELCRYLSNAPPNQQDQEVRIRSAYGNGMSLDVWQKFQRRYNVQHIVEFYAATEGNLALFNATDKVGALGFVPRIFDFLYPVKLIRPETDNPGVPLRDHRDRCVLARVNEVGLMIGEINSARVDRRFDGYTDKAATSSKVLRGVFSPADLYFNTGDLLYRDAAGFFFWSDRIGDTFRWKGENVSTAEVASVISSVSGVRECCVYGVAVPHCDGKCGMASIVLDDGVEVADAAAALQREMKLQLPPYARVLFLRFLPDIPKTSTFKHKKSELATVGFDPTAADCDGGGTIFYLNSKIEAFESLKQDTLRGIEAGSVRF